MGDVQALVRAAQKYDCERRPRGRNWSRISDDQVLRLLIGAGVLTEEEAVSAWDAGNGQLTEARRDG